MEVQNELQSDQVSEENSSEVTSEDAITIQDISILNTNYITGVSFIVGCLGLIFGALLGGVYVRIFRSK